MNEPRIHFAINCAAKSCPDLRREAVSKVMDWFAKDFNKGNLNSWLQPYKKQFVNANTKIGFFKYDWSLNKQ